VVAPEPALSNLVHHLIYSVKVHFADRELPDMLAGSDPQELEAALQAAGWLLGGGSAPGLLPIVERLSSHPNPGVAGAARAVLASLPAAPAAPDEPAGG
jgi:hypothetical protein